jgi:hypothetical protein
MRRSERKRNETQRTRRGAKKRRSRREQKTVTKKKNTGRTIKPRAATPIASARDRRRTALSADVGGKAFASFGPQPGAPNRCKRMRRARQMPEHQAQDPRAREHIHDEPRKSDCELQPSIIRRRGQYPVLSAGSPLRVCTHTPPTHEYMYASARAP